MLGHYPTAYAMARRATKNEIERLKREVAAASKANLRANLFAESAVRTAERARSEG